MGLLGAMSLQKYHRSMAKRKLGYDSRMGGNSRLTIELEKFSVRGAVIDGTYRCRLQNVAPALPTG